MKNLKKISVAGLVVGLIGATILIGWFGAGRVFHAILSVGGKWFVLFCVLQLLVMVFLGITWWAIATPGVSLRRLSDSRPYIWGRMVRDSAGSCLPFSVLGGLAAGSRAVSLHGPSFTVAAVSTIVDITAEFAAEIIFAAMALIILLVSVHDPRVRLPAQIGLLVAVVGLILVVRLQHGVAPIFVSLGKRLLGPWIAQGEVGAAAQSELSVRYDNMRTIVLGTFLHFVGWIGKGVGNWFAFHLLGVPLSLWSAMAIEGLLHAALALAIAIPGYAGVQEAGYVGLGALFGVPADLCLGVSLIRRARDMAIGVPILLIWQLVEVRRLKTQNGKASFPPGARPGKFGQTGSETVTTKPPSL